MREFFHNEKYGVFTQHAAVAVMRHSATMGYKPDIKTMQTNEMELGAPKKLWIEDENHQLKWNASNKNI